MILQREGVEIRSAECPSQRYTGGPAGTAPSHDSLRSILLRYEDNKSKAAQALGIDRTTLWRHLKRLRPNSDC
ncbi:MAG: hypothetical protein JXA71_13810 [Chitinispirillaceae bacterium]|nr:hypothetical protein [Chitinispirillaceae bacterium]